MFQKIRSTKMRAKNIKEEEEEMRKARSTCTNSRHKSARCFANKIQHILFCLKHYNLLRNNVRGQEFFFY